MDSDEIREICTERLDRWKNRLVENHATPIILLGVGHDERSGDMQVITLEEMTDTDIVVFLEGTLTLFKKKLQGSQN